MARGRQRRARFMHLRGEQVRDLVGRGDGPYVLGARVFELLEPVHDTGRGVDGQFDVVMDD